ncbi:hypothetical protein [Parahaliea mediterranea]|uniref:Tetratricopeptide repeat protein n=1 Tax=Parahaliea mediterranea TaxID=651086 RepID=A0A939IJ94_9GAMM|nr:hypothetical protein [Parahaliea mediterranea]MBN7796051.1 hypothetical protein [Parahaliea mediterranea]
MATLTRQLPVAMLLAAAGLLQACATAPDAEMEAAVSEQPQAVPELTLNLPRQREDCRCVVDAAETESRDLTFLERGYAALARGEHIDAVQYFQRYQRLESSPEADWEAAIGIAYVSMLPGSPFFDPEAARTSWGSLEAAYSGSMQVHEQSLLMRDSLEAFMLLDRHITALEASNATLQEDLAKREEALKRLRELTLGQRGARQ